MNAQLDLTGAAPVYTPAYAGADPDQLDDTDIGALAEAATLPHRAEFLRGTRDMAPDTLARSMQGAVRRGWGFWPPVTAPRGGHPGTHLHEPKLFGVRAMGATEHEAAQNWRTLARAATPGWEDAA